jgi:hypothetical protein
LIGVDGGRTKATISDRNRENPAGKERQDMWEDDNREECWEFIREADWTWLITLRYPSEPGLVPKDVQELTPDEAVECWLEAVSDEFTDGYSCESVCIKETKDGGWLAYRCLRDAGVIPSRDSKRCIYCGR